MAAAVIVSVLAMVILSLLRVNVMVSIIISALIAGLISGESLIHTVELLVEGMSGGANTALSYVLLGAFAAAISYTGITTILVKSLINVIKGKRGIMLLTIAGVASLSQNLVPVHIAFIPILIPPLLTLFDKMKVDRRGVAAALTFGLKAPYVMIPVGFGLIFHEIIRDSMVENGIEIGMNEVFKSMLIPGSGMIVGLLIAIFISYRGNRTYQTSNDVEEDFEGQDVTFQLKHALTIVAILAAVVVQIRTGDLILGALTGLIAMFILLVVPFKEGEGVMTEGIKMMGMIAFIMLVASGFSNVLKETGSVTNLVEVTSGMLGDSKLFIAIILLLVGLVVTIGIGTSFGTIPILAALYVPIATAAGFSPMAIAALIGTAGALGDAGSPASDSTLGPTSGLNADGKHNHIWDTCVPTFLHYNIPLVIFGIIAALVL
ncbi:Na+/H+ antiporter family protein [Salinibacillus xinjiangensis]|uniref:Sodium:proton antiporter n=1 Tax=Salinibacillus xinjiangensis TaxID=1229268 RepID=A0A6G1X974_9BACI|nr:Na+/H+ antiporter NhaC family protein [Salinibacillus xinjiangensis]MRG87456.1 sodium:proton antiporter [Salinibacillus xinjiangensis]